MAGASGYAGGELLRLLAAHPELEIGRGHGAHPGRAAGAASAPAPAALDAGRFAPTDADGARRRRCGLPRAAARRVRRAGRRSCPPHCRSSTSAPTTGCATPRPGRATTAARTPAPGPTACPSCPASASSSRRRRRVAAPGCYATAVTLALAPLLAAGLRRAPTTSWSSPLGHHRRRAGTQAAPARQRGDGRPVARTRSAAHQHTPEIKQACSRRRRRVTLSFTPTLAPMPRGILATCTARPSPARHRSGLRGRRCTAAYDDEPFVRVLPEGAWPHDRPRPSGSNACHLQVAVDADAGRVVVVVAPSTTSARARPGQAVQCANLIARPAPETDRPAPIAAESRRERHRADGFRAAGVAAGLKATGGPDVALVVNDGPRRRGRRLHRQPGQGRAGAVEPSRCSRTGSVAGRRAQLRRRQRLHRARRLPGHPRHRRAWSRTLARASVGRSTSRSARPA